MNLQLENAELKKKLNVSDQYPLNSKLYDQLCRLKEKFFGFGREELKKNVPRQVGHIQEQLKLHGERWHCRQDEEKTDLKSNSAAAGLGTPVEIRYHEASKEELQMEKELRKVSSSQAHWEQVKGAYQGTVEISIVERTYKKVIHRQAKYKLKGAEEELGKDLIVTAPGPVKLKPGCQYSVDFALSVVSDKYEYHLPLERQRRKMQACGLEIDVKTLYGLCETVAEHCQGEGIQKIKQDMFNDFCALHLDESPWPILGNKDRSS